MDGKQNHEVIYRWKPDNRDLYVTNLCTSVSVAECFRAMYHFYDSVHEASMNFSRAIECALTDLHKTQGKVACYPNES